MTDNKETFPVGRPRKYPTDWLLEAKIQEYFIAWEEQGRPLTMAGLICFLGVCPDTFGDYKRGLYDEKGVSGLNFSETIRRARTYVENSKLEGALLGKYNGSVAIFDLKNNHGYTDRIETKEVKKHTDVYEFNDAEEASRAYQDAVSE